MKRFALALLLCLGLSPAAQAKPWFDAETWTLANGLRVVLIPNHRAPIAHVSVWYKTGGANDLPGKSGTAHYLEHLMFLGTKDVPAGAHSDLIKQAGGDNNAYTTYDVTAFHQTVPVEKLAQVLHLEASRMRAIAPSVAKAKNEHQVIMQERHQTIESDPQRLFSETVDALMYADHSYGRPVIGTPVEIAGLTLKDAQRFHDTWYGPDNAVLIITGDVTRRQAEPLVLRSFGFLAPIHPPRRGYLVHKPVPPIANIDVTQCDPHIGQPVMAITATLPAPQADLQISLTGQVLATILNGGPTSPLYKTLVKKDRVATAISVSYDGNLRASGGFDVALWPAPGVSVAEAFAATRAALKDSLLDQISENDVRRAARQMQLEASMASDQPFALAMSVGYAMASGDSLSDLQNGPDWLDAVTLTDIKRLASDYLLNPARGTLRSALLPEGNPACGL